MITPDFAGGRYPVGSLVSFAFENQSIRGKIASLQKTKARIWVEGTTYNVPYSKLTPISIAGPECSLVEIQAMGEHLLKQHRLKCWSFGFDLARSRAGVCCYSIKLIRLSVSYCLAATRDELQNTILHEIAHALVGINQSITLHGKSRRTCLVLTDLPNVYKISSFTGESLTIIRNAWEDIKAALETTVRLINDYGVDRDSLTSTNALMPIAYYMYKTGIRYSETTSLASTNLPKAYSWLIKAL